jgi:hypothetical protein
MPIDETVSRTFYIQIPTTHFKVEKGDQFIVLIRVQNKDNENISYTFSVEDFSFDIKYN